jgi:hypothetical protein
MQKSLFHGLMAFLILALFFPATVNAAIVGHFTKVVGNVDLLKAGKLPAIRVKVKDGVEPGDIIRTKSKARAELTMVDNSVIVMAPKSRLAVADYVYDASNGNRHAVIRLFRGLVHTVVRRILKTEQPNFIMETHTATIGVRGTDFYTAMAPRKTVVYLVEGTVSVGSIASALTLGSIGQRLLHSMQFTVVSWGKQPTPPKPLTRDILRFLERLMNTGLKAGLQGLQGTAVPESSQNIQLPGFPSYQEQRLHQEYIPPVLQPQPQHPAPAPVPSYSPM